MRCQKVITVEVQIGATSQLSFNSSHKSTLFLPLCTCAALSKARAAVVKLQFCSDALISHRTSEQRRLQQCDRIVGGLCQISTVSSSMIVMVKSPTNSPTRK